MKTLIVNEKYNEKNLNRVLLDNFNGLTMNELYKTLRKKDIKVNGKRINTNITVFTNDQIEIYLPDDLLYKKTPDLNIIYEDNYILIVNKPANLEVEGSNSLTSILSTTYPNIKPCHRLDRNTTGLIIYAKTNTALEILLDKFKNRQIEKHYACIVYGIPEKQSQTLNAYLFKDAKKSLVYISDTPKKGYQKIITSYKILQTNKSNNTSLLDITLHTGKTHQIRAHLAHIGHPIVGDGKYAYGELNKKFHKKTQQLCSYSLTFNFTTDAGILNYLNHKQIRIPINLTF